MEAWTLGDISSELLFLGAFIGGVLLLGKYIKTGIEKLLESKFKALEKMIQEINDKVDKVDLETCKNFLVRFLADIERGEFIAESEKQRFWEEYEHYLDKKGNSYIKEWVNRLKKEGKL